METIREKLNKQINASKETWGRGYDHFSKIINKYNLKVGAEIGVAYGEHFSEV
jgi:phage regulator Rha-like protein